MFCPRCGQEQASGDLRFCSRCGLPMGVVSEVLANGGILPQLFELQNKKSLWTKANGAKFSLVWFLFIGILITAVLAILGGEEIVALTAALGFLGGLFILIFSVLFLPSESKYKTNDFYSGQENLSPAQFARNQNLTGNQQQNALPPQQTQNAQDYVSPVSDWKTPDTGELVRPSVTEGTTKLLHKDE